jgi:hypothetical protein
MPRYGQLHIFDSAEATTKRLEIQSNRRSMAIVRQRLDDMMRQIHPFALKVAVQGLDFMVHPLYINIYPIC